MRSAGIIDISFLIRTMKKFLFGFLAVLTLGAGCSGATTQAPENNVPANTLPREFAFADVKVGDIVEGMTVSKIEPIAAEQPLSATNVSISFEGEKTVSGVLVQSDLTSGYCLQPEQKVLPQLQGDVDTDFCFPYNKLVNEILQDRANDRVTLTIKSYTINNTDLELGNMAEIKI